MRASGEGAALAQELRRPFALTAALSLSRRWRAQGQHDAARTLLAEIYGWFADTSAGPVRRRLRTAGGGLRSAGGVETRALKEAKALLDELSQGR